MTTDPAGRGADHPDRRARSAVLLAVAIGASSALSFAVHAIASRQLPASEYGGLAALLAVMTALSVPVGAVQTALTRSAAELIAQGRTPSVRPLLRQVAPVAAALAVAGAVLADPVAQFLRIGSRTAVALAAVWVATVLVGSVGKALLIADGALRPVSHAIFEGALLRLVLVAALSPALGIVGGVAAAVAGDLLSTTVYTLAVWRRGHLRADGVSCRVEWPDAGRALSAQLSLWLFASTAVVLGRRSLPAVASGSFAAMSTAAVACLFLPQAFATIVFPRFVADGSRRLLLRATAVAGAAGIICALAICARPDLLFAMVFGPQYRVDRPVLLVLCLHFVVLGCLAVLTQYTVARRVGGTFVVWAALGTALVAATHLGSSPLTLALSLAAPTAAGAVIVVVRAVLGTPSSDAAADRSEGDGLPRRPARGSATDRHPLIDLAAYESRSEAARALKAPATLDLSVVVPTYNGGPRLLACVHDLRAALEPTGLDFEIVVSVDGSTDGSEEALVGVPRVVVDIDAVNRGKGAALRRGFGRARGRWIGFIDGDGDIASSVLVDLVGELRRSGAPVGVASKNLPGASVSMTARRRLMSAGYRALVHWMFDLPVRDTQCGCKVFRREFLAAVVPHSCENGFAIDLELLTIGHRLGFHGAVEVPVVLTRDEPGTVSGGTAVRMLRDTARIRRRLPPATTEPLPIPALAPVGVEFSTPLVP